MFGINARRLLGAAAVASALCLGAAAAHAQGYDGYGPTAGEVTVSPPVYSRSWNGAPVQVIRASRVVPTYDLDLSTDWGRYELHERVVRAAVSACDELDDAWTQGFYPTGDDGDCVGSTVRRTMVQVYGD